MPKAPRFGAKALAPATANAKADASAASALAFSQIGAGYQAHLRIGTGNGYSTAPTQALALTVYGASRNKTAAWTGIKNTVANVAKDLGLSITLRITAKGQAIIEAQVAPLPTHLYTLITPPPPRSPPSPNLGTPPNAFGNYLTGGGNHAGQCPTELDMMAILESDVNMLETELPTNGTAFFVGRINAAGHAVIKVNVVTVVTDKAFKVVSLHVNRRPEPVIAQTTQARSLLEEVFEELGIQVLAVAAEPGNRTYHAYIKVPKSMQTEEEHPSPCSRPQGHTTINENIDNTTAFNTSPCPHPPVTSPSSLNQPRHPATLLIPPLFPPITKQGYVDRIVATAALKALKGPFLKVLAKSEMGDGYAMAALILDFGSITDEKCDTCQRQQVTSGILNVGTEDNGTGKSKKITIDNDKGRLMEEQKVTRRGIRQYLIHLHS